MMAPKVSVIVPLYNVEKYLDGCISSIVNQTYSDWELILVDDGSKDSSGVIADAWQQRDCRIKCIHKANGGVSSARNTGLDNAFGEYILFVDSDDVCSIRLIDCLESAISTHYGIAVCIVKGFVDSRSLSDIEDFGKNNPENSINTLYLMLEDNGLLHLPTGKLYLKSIIDKYNLRFDTSLALGEDLCFNLDYLTHIESGVLVGSPLYYYRDTPGSLSKSIRSDYADIQMYLFDRKDQFIRENGIDYDWTPIAMGIISDMVMSICRSSASESEKLEVINRIKRHRLVRDIAKPKGLKETVFRSMIKYLSSNIIIKILR